MSGMIQKPKILSVSVCEFSRQGERFLYFVYRYYENKKAKFVNLGDYPVIMLSEARKNPMKYYQIKTNLLKLLKWQL